MLAGHDASKNRHTKQKIKYVKKTNYKHNVDKYNKRTEKSLRWNARTIPNVFCTFIKSKQFGIENIRITRAKTQHISL